MAKNKKSGPLVINASIKQFALGTGIGVLARTAHLMSRIKGAGKYALGAKAGAAALAVYGEVDSIISSARTGRQYGAISGIGTYLVQSASRGIGATFGVKAAEVGGSLTMKGLMKAASAGRTRAAFKAAKSTATAKAAAHAEATVGRAVKGTVQTTTGKTVRFVRVHGRIIPIRIALGGK